MFSKILPLLLFVIPAFTLAQTGPGGVGDPSNNGLWLRAADVPVTHNSPVSNWPDASGNGNDGVQPAAGLQPLFIDNSSMNGQPVVRLDGVDDLVEIRDNNLLDGTSGQTFFVVLRPNNLDGSNPRGILGKRVDFNTSANYAYTWFFWSGDRIYADVNTQNDRFNTGTTAFNNATNYILAFDYDGSLPSTQRSRLYSRGEVIRTASESSSSMVNSNQDLILGALNKNYRAHLSADYAEVIQYNFSLNDAQHIIVHNYLSAKYNVGLVNDNIYDQDEPANGNFDHEVAGIGRIDAANQHSTAQGTGVVGMSAPAQLDDNEFLLWGHDGGALAMGAAADLPVGVDTRMGRTWRVSEVDQAGTAVDVGAVTMRWDLSSQPSVDPLDLRLLIDTDNDGLFSDETPIAGAIDLGGGIYEFANVAGLSDNVRFTLGSTQTFLPVELTHFTVERQQRQVVLQWTTASELNSDYFDVQRSADGVTWTTIDQVISVGNSSWSTDYEAIDESPLAGWSYYRLQQVDFDGTTDYSPVRAVEFQKATAPIRVYPNPSSDYVYVEGSMLGEAPIRVFSSSGMEVTHQVASQQENSDRLRIDLSALPTGIYMLQTPTNIQQIQKL